MAKVIDGDENDDWLVGTEDADTISGKGGNDVLYGQFGNDTLNGDAGNDALYGQFGNDTMNGGDGDDRMWGGVGNDIMDGDAGSESNLQTLVEDTGNTNTLWTDSSVSARTKYVYRVQALGSGGEGAHSRPAEVVTSG